MLARVASLSLCPRAAMHSKPDSGILAYPGPTTSWSSLRLSGAAPAAESRTLNR
jgi:hypothetical protein